MAKKRFYSKSEGSSRRGIISSDKSAISNLPQSPMYYESEQPRWGNDVMSVDGTSRTIFDQVGADGAGLARHKSRTRF